MRSRQVIPLSTKHQIIRALESGETRSAVRKRFQLKNYSNINRIVGQREKIIQLHRYLERARIPMALSNQALAFRDLAAEENEVEDTTTREAVANLGLHMKIGAAIAKELQQALPRIDDELHSFEIELDEAEEEPADDDMDDHDDEEEEQEEDSEDEEEDGVEDPNAEDEEEGEDDDTTSNQVGSGLVNGIKLVKQMQTLLLQIKIVGGIIRSMTEWEDKLMERAAIFKAVVEKETSDAAMEPE